MAILGTAEGVRAPVPPPSLHWAVVLVLSIVTCGIFALVWLFVQANWVKKVEPSNNAIAMLIGYLGLIFVGAFVQGVGEGMQSGGVQLIGILLQLGSLVPYVKAVFPMRDVIDSAYSLKLSGVMTFFFAPYYFQYHLGEAASRPTA